MATQCFHSYNILAQEGTELDPSGVWSRGCQSQRILPLALILCTATYLRRQSWLVIVHCHGTRVGPPVGRIATTTKSEQTNTDKRHLPELIAENATATRMYLHSSTLPLQAVLDNLPGCKVYHALFRAPPIPCTHVDRKLVTELKLLCTHARHTQHEEMRRDQGRILCRTCVSL